MAVSLHTACTFLSLSVPQRTAAPPPPPPPPDHLSSSYSHSIRHPRPARPPFPPSLSLSLSLSRSLGLSYLFLCPAVPPLSPAKAGTDIEGLNHWQSDSNYE